MSHTYSSFYITGYLTYYRVVLWDADSIAKRLTSDQLERHHFQQRLRMRGSGSGHGAVKSCRSATAFVVTELVLTV